MAQALLLTTFLTEAGHGRLDISELKGIKVKVDQTLAEGARSGEWRFPEGVHPSLVLVINEHDRQLHEVRLGLVVEATRKLEHVLGKAS